MAGSREDKLNNDPLRGIERDIGSADEEQMKTAVEERMKTAVDVPTKADLARGMTSLGVKLGKLKSTVSPSDVPTVPPETVETGPAPDKTEEEGKTET